MRQHVTVIPEDRAIGVDGHFLVFAFPAPENLHALQWHDGAGEIELTGPVNETITDYTAQVQPFVTLWEQETARLEEEANRPPTLGDAKAAKLSAIRTAFLAAEADGFVQSSLGFRVDATRKSIGDIEGLIDLVTSGIMTAPVTFRDYDNAYHDLTLEQLSILRLEAKGRGPLLYSHKWALETELEQARTVDVVQAIDTVTGWPGVIA